MEVDDMPAPMDLDEPPIDQGMRDATVADLGEPVLNANGEGNAAVRCTFHVISTSNACLWILGYIQVPAPTNAPKHKKKPRLMDSVRPLERVSRGPGSDISSFALSDYRIQQGRNGADEGRLQDSHD